MALIYANTPLCDVVANEPSIIPVINRFGIRLGTGDATIATACSRHNLDVDFFLTILNTFINEEYFPEKILKSFCVSTIIEYLQKTNTYHTEVQLPNIDRHFGLLLQRSPSDNNLGVIQKFYGELRRELLTRINDDTARWFPSIIEMEKHQPTIYPTTETIIPVLTEESDPIADKLHDLKNLFIIHLSGNYDQNLCYGVLVAIMALEKDIKQNNRIRNRILAPIAHTMKQIIENQ